MRNYYILLSLICLIVNNSCKEDLLVNNNKVIIAGQIVDDSTYEKVYLYTSMMDFAGEIITLPDDDGEFRFEFELPSKLMISFYYENVYVVGADLLVSPGDSIFLFVTPENVAALSISGSNHEVQAALQNNYNDIWAKSSMNSSTIIEMSRERTPIHFLEKRKEKFHNDWDSLNYEIANSNNPIEFNEIILATYKVDYLYDLLKFLNYYSAFQNVCLTKDNIPKDYLRELDSLYIETYDDIFIYNYHSAICLHSFLCAFDTKDSSSAEFIRGNKLAAADINMKSYIDNYSGYQKDYLLSNKLNSLINNDYISDTIFKKYYSSISMDYFKSFLEKKYLEYNLLQKEVLDTNKIHLFNICDSDTTQLFDVMLQNHKGKTVYVDIWGTWCSSCIRNFAYMSELKQELKPYNVDYVYLALKSPEDQWRKVINYYMLEGSHYLLNRKQHLELNSTVDFETIPHYFIMNQNGEIIVDDAKAPSETDLINQIIEVCLGK